MKIKVGGNVYIQKLDAIFLLEDNFFVPENIKDEIKSGKNRTVMEEGDPYDFLVFTDLTSNYWIMSQDYIIDYESYNKLKYEELAHLCEIIEDSETRRLWSFCELDSHVRQDHYGLESKRKSYMVSHAIKSINILMNTREIGTCFNFPEGFKGAQ